MPFGHARQRGLQRVVIVAFELAGHLHVQQVGLCRFKDSQHGQLQYRFDEYRCRRILHPLSLLKHLRRQVEADDTPARADGADE